jgi:hypothetical protein
MVSFESVWENTTAPDPASIRKKKKGWEKRSFEEVWKETVPPDEEDVTAYPAGSVGESLSQLVEKSRGPDYSALTELASGAVSPAMRAYDLIAKEWGAGKEMRREAEEGMSSGRMPLGAIWWLLGALRSGFAPVTGAARGLVTEPVGENAQTMIETFSGLSDEEKQAVRQYAAENNIPLPGHILGEIAGAGVEVAGFGTYARIIKLGMPHGEKLGGVLGRAAGEERVIAGGYPEGIMGPPKPTAKAEATVADVVDDAGRPTVGVTHIDEAAPGLVERMSVKLFGEVARNPDLVQRVEAARRSGKVGERLYVSIGNELFEAMRRGDLGSENLLKILDDLGVDPVEVFKQTASEGGRNLNTLSQIAKQLAKQKTTPAPLRKELDDISADLERRYGTGSDTIPAKIWSFIGQGLNVWRASMVSQLVTAIRNAIGQTGRLGIGIIDDAIQAGLRGTSGRESVRGIINSLKADGKALKDSIPLIRDKKLLDNILDGNPITEGQLLNKSVHEIDIINRYARFINSANILQERFFRRVAFQARLDKNLKEKNFPDINTIDPKKIPAELLDDAVQHALDISFASSGGKIARTITKGFEAIPPLYTVHPFPRFAFGNALPFLIEHSPLGLLKALGPKSMRELAKGNTRTFTRSASRGLIGTTMLGAAMQMRDHPNAGERYYEWYTGPRDLVTGERPYIDLRAFAPFTTYLFMAEALKGKDANLTAMDYANATIGINRISGTGLMFVDMLRAKKGETLLDTTAKFVGQNMGVFTYPLKQVVDVEYAVKGGGPARDISDDSLWGKFINPTLANTPIAERKILSERIEMLRKNPERFVPFITTRTKNVVEAELDRLGILRYTQSPKGGTKDSIRFRMGLIQGPTEQYGLDATRTITSVMLSDMPVKDLHEMKGLNNLSYPAALEPDKSYKELGDEGKKLILKSVLGHLRAKAKSRMKELSELEGDPLKVKRFFVDPSEEKDMPQKPYLEEVKKTREGLLGVRKGWEKRSFE